MQATIPSELIDRDEFAHPAVEVARFLLGKRLVRRTSKEYACIIITETEAYDGENDLACHAHSGRTKRNAVMYGPPGHAYIYFTYGMHWLLNCVTGTEGYPAAVLIRAALPLENSSFIAVNRPGIKPALWLNGPARLTRALQINGSLNGIDLCVPGELTLEHGFLVTDSHVLTSARVGVDYAGEPWKSMPWRFLLKDAEKWLADQSGVRIMV
jgi:DNA-3-methyladenine glycosylase